jgi:hypothetical protein
LRRSNVEPGYVIAEFAFGDAEHGRQLAPIAPRHGESTAHINGPFVRISRKRFFKIISAGDRGLASSQRNDLPYSFFLRQTAPAKRPDF